MEYTRLIELVIVGLPPTLLALATLIQQLKTHHAFNSKMDAMLAITRREGVAQGKLDERAARHLKEGEAAVARDSLTSHPAPASAPIHAGDVKVEAEGNVTVAKK